nr:putative reverse transcriptase domain, ribonuclease H-like domain, aspartic peptidase domain protein [Tanacetum cinerariifolium]
LKIPEWKWKKITMDLVTKLPKSSSRYDVIWVIVDRLAKSAHFLPIHEDYKTEKLARIYINEIVARHGVPMSIILDCDGRFAWDTHLLLVEFSYNNSYHKSIKCAPFEALYGRKCRSPVMWAEVGESQLIGPESCKRPRRRLCKLRRDSDLQVPLEEIKVDDKLYFVEEPIEIVDSQVKKLKQSYIPIVKVRWNSQRGDEFTWEREEQFKAKYPHLFATSSSAAIAN